MGESGVIAGLRKNLTFVIYNNKGYFFRAFAGLAFALLTYLLIRVNPTSQAAYAPLCAIIVLILSGVRVWAGMVSAVAMVSYHAFLWSPELCYLLLVCSALFMATSAFGYEKAVLVGMAPVLDMWGLGLFIPLTCGIALGKRRGPLWAFIAYIWAVVAAVVRSIVW